MGISRLKSTTGIWETSQEYQQQCPNLTSEKFMQVTNLLLECPNLNSTHLFRADILYDSAQILKTVAEKEQQCDYLNGTDSGHHEHTAIDQAVAVDVPQVEGATLVRRILRRLIPRKPQLDRPLEQWCYIYEMQKCPELKSSYVVVYVPDVQGEADMPWYHPPVKALAYLYEQAEDHTTLSTHFLPFDQNTGTVSERLHRTFISLLQTFLRLAKGPGPESQPDSGDKENGESTSTSLSMTPSTLKDTILPQHIVQNTYTRLKQKYAQDLISRWAEKTEPSKHVFEDLSIAAFVIELWKQMYTPESFPGFVDIACGNGVLSYVLIKEGYLGRGFDARRRKTWEVLEMDPYLDEMICVPQPFLDIEPSDPDSVIPGSRIHSGLFKPGTFIISNHADELTPWTPILAALACPRNPLPFLAIPCCSHALSGAKHRYSPKNIRNTSIDNKEEQPASGDLKALRAAKAKAANHADDKSMYACLTRKVVAIAEGIGFDIELTLMRIPSTRNIGIVGNRKRAAVASKDGELDAKLELNASAQYQVASGPPRQPGSREHISCNQEAEEAKST
ncbi:tRNA(Ser) Um(44) 2'-O-methyltransferase [Elasticomyces elasticus]|uniref:tRNA (uracil-O(2)-)-methyltransferase n=1 Tax=Exophiala sideris TaxID=1016849 RepID=A0ABR0JL94_9EURO|nr:tRNA(Ser) Um(44) 2'-O-methyltransferase [Elasticomyces elasticus]KAK5036371.1 tRNA(Ser) Um(44) 2'-O-methyltransferase [Exophiala sideris]KAK5041797.1 tRNA(Ser) Um(44) 2'-O-methyltransferase [Exophiala sideris]KAK5066755.1 tRNA(Ser) Um(44) 2'-O-methyltransferase [Exophiala sideris]KAK5184813.1 tRNA(Ser) Um(44) 2'-O-methyltransferase [Eurotiomycetes sp. CCFEE 6388]